MRLSKKRDDDRDSQLNFAMQNGFATIMQDPFNVGATPEDCI